MRIRYLDIILLGHEAACWMWFEVVAYDVLFETCSILGSVLGCIADLYNG